MFLCFHLQVKLLACLCARSEIDMYDIHYVLYMALRLYALCEVLNEVPTPKSCDTTLTRNERGLM